MKYLADTQILVWALEGNAKLSDTARKILLDENNTIFFSFANVWEVAIKHHLHKDDIPFSSEDFDRFCREAGYIPFGLKFQHAHELKTLVYAREEAPRDHRDPFDRLLLAIAKTEGFGFITHDSLIPYYHEECTVSV